LTPLTAQKHWRRPCRL